MLEAQTNAPNASESPGTWLSVADFATLHNRSIRTVKRWIEDGEVESKKEGANRFVRPKQKGHTSDTNGTQPEGHTAPEVSQSEKSTLGEGTQEGHKGDTQGPQQGDRQSDTVGTQAVSLGAEREKELRGEIMFLRGLVEQHQRSEAELRAALREALKISSRQLSEGTPQTATAGRDGPQIAQVDNVSPTPPEPENRPQVSTVEAPRRGDALAKIREGIMGLFASSSSARK